MVVCPERPASPYPREPPEKPGGWRVGTLSKSGRCPALLTDCHDHTYHQRSVAGYQTWTSWSHTTHHPARRHAVDGDPGSEMSARPDISAIWSMVMPGDPPIQMPGVDRCVVPDLATDARRIRVDI